MKRPRAVLLVGLLAGTLAVRPQLTAVGPLLPEIQNDFGIDHATAGLLVTVPVLCMGLFALPVARLLRRTDVRTATGWCLATIAIATVLRPLSPGFAAMVALTFVFGVGSGVVGALLPVVVKERFAERPALGTGVFALGLNVGATLGAGLAVPLALATDSWRWSLGVLALAGALAVPAWVRLSRHSLGDALPVETVDHLPWRSGFAWSATLVFGFQALCFFGLNAWLADALIERGWREGSAGALVALLNMVAIAGVLLVALLGGRVIGVRLYLALASAGLVTGTVGLGVDGRRRQRVGLGRAHQPVAGLAVRACDDALRRRHPRPGRSGGAREHAARGRLHDGRRSRLSHSARCATRRAASQPGSGLSPGWLCSLPCSSRRRSSCSASRARRPSADGS